MIDNKVGLSMMRYDPDRHHRHSIRLRGYDYSRGGAYFITICIYDRECLLSEINEEKVILSEVGSTVEAIWCDLPKRFPFIVLDEYVLMPNHLHGIVCFVDVDRLSNEASSKITLGKVLRTFKSLSGIQANRLLERTEHPFWQRNYHDRIIRDDQELGKIRAYIRQNPQNWEIDTENIDASPTL